MKCTFSYGNGITQFSVNILACIDNACHLRAKEWNTKQIYHAANSTHSFSIDNTPSVCRSNAFYNRKNVIRKLSFTHRLNNVSGT